MRTKRYYSLNETGAVIWRLLENETPVTEIVMRMVDCYDVEEAMAALTVEQLLEELVGEALIAPTPG
jgi:hypothetical protein